MSAVALGGERNLRGGSRLAGGAASWPGSRFAGTRIFLVIWMYALVGTMASTAYSYRHLFARPLSGLRSSPASRTTPRPGAERAGVRRLAGALIVWKAGLFAAGGAGLLGIFAVIRHTRRTRRRDGWNWSAPPRSAGTPRWPPRWP